MIASQGRAQLVLALVRHLLKLVHLLQHSLGLGHQRLRIPGDAHLARPALEQRHPQLLLEFADGGTEGGLADMAGLGGTAEMMGACQGDEIA